MIETFDAQYDLLIKKKNELLQHVNVHNSRYMHVNTLNNLVYHFREIKDEEDKQWIFTRLINYMEVCLNFGNDLLDKKTSYDLFDKYLMKIVFYYSENVGFALLFNRGIIAAFYIALFLILSAFFGFKIGLIALALALVHYSYWVVKFQKKKVYGMFY